MDQGNVSKATAERAATARVDAAKERNVELKRDVTIRWTLLWICRLIEKLNFSTQLENQRSNVQNAQRRVEEAKERSDNARNLNPLFHLGKF